MDADRLKSLLSTLPDPPLEEVSDSALFSLSHICISVHNLIVVNGLDRTYGNRKAYQNRINDLQKSCCKRCGREMQPDRRSRMARLWFSLINEPALVFTDGQKDAACREAALEVIRDYLKEREKRPEKKLTLPWKEESEEEFDVLRCMADLLYPPYEYEEEEKKILQYLKRKIARWAEQMNTEGRWPALPVEEALERIEIMNRYSCLFSDATYEERIGWAYAHYCHLFASDRLTTVDRSWENMRMLGRLYDVTMQNLLYPRDKILAARIAGCLHEYGRLFPEGSDARLYGERYVIDYLCERIMDELQRPDVADRPQTNGIKSAEIPL